MQMEKFPMSQACFQRLVSVVFSKKYLAHGGWPAEGTERPREAVGSLGGLSKIGLPAGARIYKVFQGRWAPGLLALCMSWSKAMNVLAAS